MTLAARVMTVMEMLLGYGVGDVITFALVFSVFIEIWLSR